MVARRLPMRIVWACVLVLCVLVLGSVPVFFLQAASAPASAVAQTASPQSVSHLPPEKLAKAIALNRIRDIEHFVDAFWGLLVLWLLLATRAAAGLETWAVRVLEKRGVSGGLFFSV